MKVFLFSMAALLALWMFPEEQTDPELDSADTVAMFKASYLFKFASSNDWPESTKTGPFRIAVSGNEAILRELSEKYATKSIGSQVLEVLPLEEAKNGDHLHIIYFGGTDKEDELLMKKAPRSGTMIVAEGREALKNGATIGFVTVDNATRYVLNHEEAKKRSITLGSTIILWAVSN